MTLQSISFGLAILLGIIAFALVKHTADEFDKWYEVEADGSRLRIPAALVGVVVTVVGAAFLFLR